MDFRHLRAFITVAEESSVTKAAERLHISQPPLSRHIKQLEDELGITLFVRHRQGVTLTDAGAAPARESDACWRPPHRISTKARARRRARCRTGARRHRLGTVGHGQPHPRRVGARSSRNLTIEATDVLCAEHYNRTAAGRLARRRLRASATSTRDTIEARAAVPGAHPRRVERGQPARVAKDAAACAISRPRRCCSGIGTSCRTCTTRFSTCIRAKAGMTPRTIPTPDAGPYNQAGLMLVARARASTCAWAFR